MNTRSGVGNRMKVFWNKDYTSINFDFDTSRKSNHIVDFLESDKTILHDARVATDFPIVEVTDPEKSTDISVTERLINAWLTPEYVEALKTNNDKSLSQSQGFSWCTNTYKFARAHTHGLIASVDEVIANGGRSGSLSSGLHHASRSGGGGFCTVNGIALSAIYAVERGLEPIVLDFDAHCGGGTMDFLRAHNEVSETKIRHIDLSTNFFDSYEIGANEPWAKLHVLSADENYLDEVEKELYLTPQFITDKTLFIYNAGIDPIGSAGIDEKVIVERERIVSDFISSNMAIFALAGGYSGRSTTRDDVARLHLETVYGWSWQMK